MNISFYDLVSKTTPTQTLPIDQFLHSIRYGKWQKLIEKCRSFQSKEQRDSYKKSHLPGVTVSGVFSQRNESGLVSHSGFISIDIDNQEIPRETVCKDPYTYALIRSASGNGYFILVRIVPEKHKESFYFLQSYYFENYGIVVDSAPQNVASARFVSYDPDLYINTSSKVSRYKVRKEPRVAPLPLVFSNDDISDMVRQVVSKGISIAEDYVSYRNLGFALSSHLGETGRNHFHALSQLSPKYNQVAADKQYDACLKGGNKGISIGTFYYMVKEAGLELPKRDQKPVQIAAIAKKAGRSKEAVAAQLVELNSVDSELASRVAEEVFSRPDITLKTLASDPEHLIESLVNWMKLNHPMKRNEVSEKIENNVGIINTERINTIYLQARGQFNSPQVSKDLIESIIYSEFTPPYNPFHRFYAQHGSVSSTGNIDALIASISTTTTLAPTFIRKWLISLHAAIDGHPVRTMLVLVGPQYNGKTEFFRNLLPATLKPYYAESKMDRGKDDELLMCQKLIVMDDEMGGKSKQDEKRLKELTSKDTFSLRAAYRRDNQDYKRLAVLCGTSNTWEIINDPTGNTRILPVYVDSIKYAAYNAVDKVALFMESYRAYKDGEPWQLSQEEIDPLNDLSADFSETPYERELIIKFFKRGDYEFLTATEIKNEIELNSKQSIRNMRRFGIELRKVLGEPQTKRKGDMPSKVYGVIPLYKSSPFPESMTVEPPF